MRKRYKYFLDAKIRGKVYLSIDRDSLDHEKGMGGYSIDEAYKSKTDFFNKYFFRYHYNRLEDYDKFLRKHLNKRGEILSIGSGRCANELFLLKDGYRITCSDLKKISIYDYTKALFPKFEFTELNILFGPATKKYDSVISLAVINYFDEQEISMFFQNVFLSLKAGGGVILDSAGSTDNLLSYLINEILLKYETYLIRLIRLLTKGGNYGFIIKHHGYRRTDEEIVNIAQQSGFELIDKENYGFTTDFKRSYLLRKLINIHPEIERMFSCLGRNIPHIRMLYFKKAV